MTRQPVNINDLSYEQADKEIALAKRAHRALVARGDLMTFVKFTSPDPEDPNDIDKSSYVDARVHKAIAAALEKVVEGEIPFLILTVPPRHGKSQLVSRHLPAWFAGKFPRQNVVVATYNDDFAADFGAEVRKIIQSPQYRQVFPRLRLIRGGTAKDRLQTTDGGQLTFVGRGGSLTGRGAHCFVGGTLVMSADGPRAIETITAGDTVLAYEDGRLTPRRVQAVSRREGARVLRIASAAGRVVEATADHPFHVEGRWVEAGQLAPGDPLVCAVWRDGGPACVRRSEASGARSRGVLLLERLLGTVREYQAPRGAALHALRRPGAAPEELGESGPLVLLARVLRRGAAGGVRAARALADAALRAVQCHVLPEQLARPFLLEGLLVSASRGGHGRGGQPALEGWRVREPGKASCDAAVSRDAASCDAAGRGAVPTLPVHGNTGGSPHRREPAEQSGGELGDGLPGVSSFGALLGGEGDSVAAVEDLGRVADVYDLQVEGAHNFFANGILVHNCLILDDLIKDDKEASSKAIRDAAWTWFTRVAMTRRMGKKLVIMTFTRWHSDDPIGRLTDPENEHYDEKIAEKIKIINLPGLAEDDDPLGRAPGEALWPDGPDRFDEEFLLQQRRLDPIGFSALYQQRPTVEDGELFRREHVNYYRDLPENLRFYAASDHAVATGQRSDRTALLKIGVDPNGHIYLVDLFWEKAKTDRVVEAMLAMGTQKGREPLIWWAEKGHISKSIGPFLRTRMLETQRFFNLVEVTPIADKQTRAQAISARMALGLVHFPQDAWWTQKAIDELLGFPNGLHDDFVDAMSLIGLGLRVQVPADVPKPKAKAPEYGTLGWIKAEQRRADRAERSLRFGGF